MPVKVRCPSCDKVLNAPDTARGKAIKCPGCDTRIKVPADGAPGEPAKKRAAVASHKEDTGSETLDAIANIDFSKIADSSGNMCPRCGADIPDNATECPQCGVDPATGKISDAARKRASRKGPDTALYYSEMWKDCWQFTREHMRLVRRTTINGVVFGLVAAFCAFMVSWCSSGPPKTFWAGFLLVSTLIMPGWSWLITISTVRVTASRKGELNDLNFDLFENVALGLKVFLWSIVFLLPVTFPMAPLAMIHMAMPVTTKAWMFPVMIPIFFRNLAPTLYWWLVFLAGSIVLVGVNFGSAFLFAPAIMRVAEVMQEKGGGLGALAATTWVMLGLLALTTVVQTFMSSFFLIYAARGIGRIAYYFQNNLGLVTLVAEKAYVKKEIKLDRHGNPIKTRQQKIKEGLLSAFVFLLVCGVGYFVYRTLFPAPPPESEPAAQAPAAAAPGP